MCALRRELRWNKSFTTNREGVSITAVKCNARSIDFVVNEDGEDVPMHADLGEWVDLADISVKFLTTPLTGKHTKFANKPVVIIESLYDRGTTRYY